MSFKDNLKTDIENVFFNTEHYAISGNYYYDSINYDISGNYPIETIFVFYPYDVQKTYGSSREMEISDSKVFIKKYNLDSSSEYFEINVSIGDYFEINDNKYTITDILDDTDGVFECNCIKFTQTSGVASKNITYYRNL